MANVAVIDVPTVDFDLTDWEFNQDPYPVMDEWRELGPVVYNARHDRYMTFSYRNCAKVLGNVSQFNSQSNLELLANLVGGITMEALDSPRHHEMRNVWAHDFKRASLEEQQRQLVTEVVATAVDSFAERVLSGEVVDAIPGMTRIIPTLVIAKMLGIEPDMYRQFSEWSEAIGVTAEGYLDTSPRGQQILEKAQAATRALNDYIAGAIAMRRERGPDDRDLVSKMVFHEFAESMDEQEIVASNTQLVFAGNDTTAKMMAATLVALAQHPDQRRALVADRSLIPQAFEEVLRWSTLVQSLARHACSEESEVEGIHIPLGAEMMPMMGAGNRDPTRWENPNEFDIFRPSRQHLGFGFGMHACLGIHLARLEVRIWLNRLLDKLPDYELAGPVTYGRSFVPRAPLAVPIALAKPAASP